MKILKVIIYLFALIGFGFTVVYLGVRFHLTDTKGIIDTQNTTFLQENKKIYTEMASSSEKVAGLGWQKSEEWQVLKAGIIKDTPLIEKVATETGVEGRIIVAQLVSEQLRLYTSDREIFKTIFAPLKILGSQTQFSWGIMGLKDDTARQIENNLKQKDSPFYLGPEFEHLLDFHTDDPDQERFSRITDQHDHYYAYLYTALYIKQIMHQWQTAGYDISKRPDILSTLYNIGFKHSFPKQNPQSGGAEITINGQTYSFGRLASDFYYSEELPTLK